jgi:hypothetical protein
MDEIAAAAREAGLQFIIFTDHGDGTAAPAPPAYRHGVLTIDGVEISTSGGHYAAVGMTAAPYPLGGEPRDVVEDVARLGGFGVVAHGDSPRSELQWTDWAARFDGIEWPSLDSAWRRASLLRLSQAFATYWFRPAETLGALLSVSPDLVQRIDTLARDRSIVLIGSTDAHGPVVPSYRACFEAMATRVELDEPLSGDAGRDARVIVGALRAGRHFTAVDAVAEPVEFSFAGSSEGFSQRVSQGGELPAGRRAIFEARATGAPDAEIELLRNGEAVRRSRAQTIVYQADDQPAVYRVEVYTPRSSVPWIVSNAIYVESSEEPAKLSARGAQASVDVADSGRQWMADRDSSSRSSVEPHASRPGAVVFRYALGDGPANHQSASLLAPVPPDLSQYDRLMVDAEASGPMRVTIQLVRDNSGSWSTWRRSVYLDSVPRTMTIFFDDLTPGPLRLRSGQAASSGQPPLADIDALVFGVDTANTRPGSSGEIIFNRVAFQR